MLADILPGQPPSRVQNLHHAERAGGLDGAYRRSGSLVGQVNAGQAFSIEHTWSAELIFVNGFD